MTMKIPAFLAGVALVAIVSAVPAAAHNLVMEAYVVGNTIEGEAFFSDGTFATNRTISVTDSTGKEIQQVQTDDKGNFSYVPTQAVTQQLMLDMGSGHVAKVKIDGAKLAGGSAVAAPASTAPSAPATTTGAARAAAGTPDTALRAQIDQIVAQEVAPLRSAVEDYRTHNDMMNILAAIGLLCGFGGVLLFSAGAAKAKAGASGDKGGMASPRSIRAA